MRLGCGTGVTYPAAHPIDKRGKEALPLQRNHALPSRQPGTENRRCQSQTRPGSSKTCAHCQMASVANPSRNPMNRAETAGKSNKRSPNGTKRRC